MAANIVITGASSGIGAALAEAYAEPGATLLLTARDAARLEAAAETARAKGAVVQTATVDVTAEADMAATLTAFDDEHPIDILIANAGIAKGGYVLQDCDGAPELIIIATGSEVTPFGGVEVSHTPVLILSPNSIMKQFLACVIVCSDRREDGCVVNRCALTGASSAKDDRHRSWCHRRRIGSFKKPVIILIIAWQH